MARHAQPREVAELKGATRHDPQRYTMEPVKSEFELGQAPQHLSPAAQAAWFELSTYAPKGVLTGGERLLIEVTANLIAEYREDPRAFAAAKIGHLIGSLARLGMSPADRQKLGTPKAEKKNEFEEF
jgi:hypothetical protein